MVKVGSREFKNRLGRYLRAVRQGKTLIVTDRGKAVAKVSPPDDEPESAMTLDEIFRKAEADGLVRLGKASQKIQSPSINRQTRIGNDH